ncbi:KpsF/GutQ family sugar-phosphate isomerase [Entomomonas moraniae]|uniref:Arabinose 5-phosphate isomerase n=1 Tax=Entomomonas moraniae TaxID=2213226 RepID=A0A3S9XB58_9GAMM|nr:KpsF/GutQ family sugar-phosphate isomerase [Entomomonas moraniae]AZS49581.1 KpsF/GutQ family sugar-phosphate isomerase [Entomomonas moraniae]
MQNDTSFIKTAKRTIELELQAIDALKDHIDENFVTACKLILNAQDRIVVLGIGKSGHIGRKIAATLASTGTPAFFVHPAEASHGDMGMITQQDVILAISNSGSTTEIITLLPLIKRLGIKLISMTGNANSALAKAADVNLDISVKEEACPLNLAPTSSTTATLVLGDALAISLLEARGFTAEDFAFSHPGGALGRRLLLKVSDIMHTGDELPKIPAMTPLKQVLLEMSRAGLGIALAVDANNKLLGVFTDGDLRRVLDRASDIRKLTLDQVMTSHSKTAKADMLAAEALKIMDDHKISVLPIVDDQNNLIGVLHIHDLTRAGVI